MTADLKDTGCKPQAHGSADPGGGPCPRCGRPRCCASAKSRPGERCRRNPHPGATICDRHGLTEAAKAKAAERRQEAAAGDVVRKLVWDTDAKPVTSAIDALQLLAGRLTRAADVLGEDVDAGDLDPVRATAWLRVVRELRQLLTEMERLGIAQAVVQVEADRLRLIALALAQVFDALELDSGQRELGTRVLFEALRSSLPARVGEVSA